jgi:hypothetical protein
MMPAGKYYIGDLCYVMHDEWDEFCGLTISGHDCLEGEFNLKDGRRFATFSTKWGDGEYRSNISTKHAVDAGLIGCIRVEDIRDKTYDNLTELGAVVEFHEPFQVSGGRSTEGRNWDGIIKFGHVEIDTDGDAWYDEEEEVEEEEES